MDGNSYRKAYWTISPEVRPDVYYAKRNKHERKVTFYTEIDSISFDVVNGAKYDFIILLNGKDSAYTRISTLRESYKNNRGVEGSSDTIPFWIGKDNKLHIKGKINGSEELDFMFDTGADQCVLFRSGLNKVKLNFDGTIQNSGFGGINTRQTSNQNDLEIANLLWENEAIMFIDAKTGEDGILGYNVFEDKVVEINYDERIMIVHDKPVSVDATYSLFNIRYAGTLPLINLTLLNGGTAYTTEVVFDMGAKTSLFLTQMYLADNDLRATLKKTGTRTSGGVGSRTIKSDYAIVPEVKIGNISLRDVPADLEVVSPDPIIHHNLLGMDIIKRFNAVIDYQNQKIYLKPNNLLHAKYVAPPGWPLWAVIACTGLVLLVLSIGWYLYRRRRSGKHGASNV